jgi:hypothetical protein
MFASFDYYLVVEDEVDYDFHYDDCMDNLKHMVGKGTTCKGNMDMGSYFLVELVKEVLRLEVSKLLMEPMLFQDYHHKLDILHDRIHDSKLVD